MKWQVAPDQITSYERAGFVIVDTKNFDAIFDMYPECRTVHPVHAVMRAGTASLHNGMELAFFCPWWGLDHLEPEDNGRLATARCWNGPWTWSRRSSTPTPVGTIGTRARSIGCSTPASARCTSTRESARPRARRCPMSVIPAGSTNSTCTSAGGAASTPVDLNSGEPLTDFLALDVWMREHLPHALTPAPADHNEEHMP